MKNATRKQRPPEQGQAEFLKGPMASAVFCDPHSLSIFQFPTVFRRDPERAAVGPETIFCQTKWWQDYKRTCWVLAHLTDDLACPHPT